MRKDTDVEERMSFTKCRPLLHLEFYIMTGDKTLILLTKSF